MNLRDEPINISPGETGISVGCDFSVLGKVSAIREASLTWQYSTNIQHAEICYIGSTRYILTTHATGLYYRTGGGPVLIDADFTGTFKADVVNNEYIVLMNSSYWKKWKPGWASTYQLGLNTPPSPTLAAGALASRTLDDFEENSDWSATGGGSGGAKADDAVNYFAGAKAMKLTCDAGYTLSAKKTANYNLSYVETAGDAGSSDYISLSFYAYNLQYVNSIKLKFSCESGAGFTKDYYEMKITLGGYIYCTLKPSQGEWYPVVGDITESFKVTDIVGGMARTEYDPETKTLKVFTQVQDQPTYESYLVADESPVVFSVSGGGTSEVATTLPIDINQIVLKSKNRDMFVSSATWVTLKIPKSDFVRHGDTTGRNWSTITAIQIELEAVGGQAQVSFDQLLYQGGGNLWGYYWVAVAYQNELGNYGPYSSFVGPVYLESQKLEISGLTLDTDAQTTARRIAILGGSIPQPMVYTLENNTATTLTFNETETSLEQVETYFNNKKPVVGSDFTVAFGRIWIVGMSGYGNRVSYSEAGFFEGFPLKNYKSVHEGEQLKQVVMLGDNIAVRGSQREYIVQLVGANHSTWRIVDGAREGAVTNRLLLDLGGAQVYSAPTRLYMSAPGLAAQGGYLDKVCPIISDFMNIIGALTGEKAYLYFKDKSNIDRIMRIDYSLGKPVAHYLMSNVIPVSIMADSIAGKVYYAYGANIYQFEGGTNPLPMSLTIAGQYCKNRNQKTFGPLLSYELTGGDATLTLKLDRQSVDASISMPEAIMPAEPICLPQLVGRHLELTITSSDDITLYLPIEIESEQVGL